MGARSVSWRLGSLALALVLRRFQLHISEDQFFFFSNQQIRVEMKRDKLRTSSIGKKGEGSDGENQCLEGGKKK